MKSYLSFTEIGVRWEKLVSGTFPKGLVTLQSFPSVVPSTTLYSWKPKVTVPLVTAWVTGNTVLQAHASVPQNLSKCFWVAIRHGRHIPTSLTCLGDNCIQIFNGHWRSQDGKKAQRKEEFKNVRYS